MKKPDGKRFCPLSKKPLAIEGWNTRGFQGFRHTLTVCPKTIPFGHDCGSRFRGPSPEERVLYSSGSGAGSYSRMVTHGPLE